MSLGADEEGIVFEAMLGFGALFIGWPEELVA